MCDQHFGKDERFQDDDTKDKKYDPDEHPESFTKMALMRLMNGFYKGLALANWDMSKWRKQDWICPIPAGGCGTVNFAKREKCTTCEHARPDNYAQKNLQPGDWICPRDKGGCGTVNFRSRDECIGNGPRGKCTMKRAQVVTGGGMSRHRQLRNEPVREQDRLRRWWWVSSRPSFGWQTAARRREGQKVQE